MCEGMEREDMGTLWQYMPSAAAKPAYSTTFQMLSGGTDAEKLRGREHEEPKA